MGTSSTVHHVAGLIEEAEAACIFSWYIGKKPLSTTWASLGETRACAVMKSRVHVSAGENRETHVAETQIVRAGSGMRTSGLGPGSRQGDLAASAER